VLAAYLFWALLLLPGLAVARRWAPREVERGALSAVALGYAATLALLSPLSLLCYLLRLPAWAFSTAVALAIATGAVALARMKPWRGWRWPRAPEVLLGALLLTVHLVLAARLGSWLDGDATYHVGRTRDLLDHGFSNRDFYTALTSWNYAYSLNLMHALCAASVQLTGQDQLLAWSDSLPWAQLVIAAAHYHLAHVLFGRSAAGWLAVAIVVVLRAPETYAFYPNLLAVGWLAPLLVAYGCAAHAPAMQTRTTAATLALLAFVLGQVHAMYWGFCAVALVPLFGLRLAHALRADRSRARWFALCLLAVLAGAPFAAVTRYAGAAAQATQLPAELAVPFDLPPARARTPRDSPPNTDTPALAAGGGHLEKQLEHRAGGLAVPVERAGGLLFLALGALALALCVGLERTRRLPLLALCAAAVTLLAIPLLPPLAGFFIAHGLPGFGVARMVTLACSLLIAAIAGAVALLVERLPRPQLALAAALVLCAIGSTQLLGHAPRSYREHVNQALAPAAERHTLRQEQRDRQALLRAHVPRGELVLATLREARYATMLHDVRVLAADRGHARVPYLSLRQHHVELMTGRKTPWPLRAALVDHHRMRFTLYRDKHAKQFAWARAHGTLLGRAGGWQLVKLDRLRVP
jgi:hypothetical protein